MIHGKQDSSAIETSNSTTSNQPVTPEARALSLVVLVVCLLFIIWLLYAIYTYFADDVEHPVNAVVAFLGFTQRPFLKSSEFSIYELLNSLTSVLSAFFFYFSLAFLAAELSQRLRDLIEAGGYNALKAARAAMIAQEMKEAAESFSAPVNMPQLTKEQWYETLKALQFDIVRTHDSLHGSINQHPAVRERAEHSMGLMGDVCSIIVRELPEFESCLTDSFKSARENSNQHGQR